MDTGQSTIAATYVASTTYDLKIILTEIPFSPPIPEPPGVPISPLKKINDR